MNKKKNLFNLFTQDVSYNYHLIKTEEPNGHLVYLIKNGKKLETDTLEFSPTKIVEDLVKECDIKLEKFAPALFFTKEFDTEILKEKLNDKLSEDSEFSLFIDTIKDEYRILEVKDSLLYTKDPDAYEDAKRKEKNEHQKELLDEVIKQMEDKKKKREDYLLSYDNDLMKLIKDQLESVIEYEKQDFDFTSEIEKIVGNLIDEESWIKIDDKPFICKIDVVSLEKDKMDVFLTDNNDYSYTATLRFDKTVLLTENIIRINKGDKLPKISSDYELLSVIYDVDVDSVKDWEYKNDTERFEYLIDYLAPIFKEKIEKEQNEFVEKILKEEKEKE